MILDIIIGKELGAPYHSLKMQSVNGSLLDTINSSNLEQSKLLNIWKLLHDSGEYTGDFDLKFIDWYNWYSNYQSKQFKGPWTEEDDKQQELQNNEDAKKVIGTVENIIGLPIAETVQLVGTDLYNKNQENQRINGLNLTIKEVLSIKPTSVVSEPKLSTTISKPVSGSVLSVAQSVKSIPTTSMTPTLPLPGTLIKLNNVTPALKGPNSFQKAGLVISNIRSKTSNTRIDLGTGKGAQTAGTVAGYAGTAWNMAQSAGLSTGSKTGDTAISSALDVGSQLLSEGGANPYALAGSALSSIIGASSDSRLAQGGSLLIGAAGNWLAGGSPYAAAIGAIDTLAFGNNAPSEYSGKKGGITQGLDMGYDALMAGAASIPGPGTIISAAMAANKLDSHLGKALGGGTDGMTTADAIFGSSFGGGIFGALGGNPIAALNMLNGFTGKTTTSFTKDSDIYNNIGGSYLGSNALADEVGPYAGKKFGGLFSSGAYNKWEGKIQDALRQQSLLASINKESLKNKLLQQTMLGSTLANLLNELNGGYQISYAKEGGLLNRIFGNRLNRAHKIIIETKKIIIEPVEEIKEETKNIIPEGALHANLNHMDTPDITKKGIPVVDNEGELQAEIERNEIIFRLEVTQLIENLQKEGSDEAAIKAGKLLTEEILHNTEDRTGLIDLFKQGGEITQTEEIKEELPSFLLKLENGEIVRNYNKRDEKTKVKELEWLDENPWFKEKYKWNGLTESYMSPEDLMNWVINKEWGENDLDKIKEIPEHKNGGTVNVIPEGALHARLHHMDNDENITKKGIPVIDNNGEQLAEIELNEIIFRLDVTKKLEELCKSDSENSAIEAGKLLTKEILYNTNDNTGLINTING